MSGLIKIDLPKPLSTNRLFKNKAKGRACTEAYNAWKWHALAAIQAQKPIAKPTGPVRIFYEVGEVGVSAKMDGDNCFKCLTDALVDNGILPDDSREFIRSVGMEWVLGKEGVTAHISPADLVEIPIRGIIT